MLVYSLGQLTASNTATSTAMEKLGGFVAGLKLHFLKMVLYHLLEFAILQDLQLLRILFNHGIVMKE